MFDVFDKRLRYKKISEVQISIYRQVLSVKMANLSVQTWNKGVYLALVKLLHFIAFVQFLYAIYYNVVHVHPPANIFKTKRTKFGGNFQFLTFWNAVSQSTRNYFLLKLFTS